MSTEEKIDSASDAPEAETGAVPSVEPEPTPDSTTGAAPPGDKPVAKTKKVTKKPADKKKKAAPAKKKAAPAKKKPAVAKKKPAAKKKAKPRTDVPKNLTLPLSKIQLSDEWNREELGDISGMVASLQDVGQVTPVSVWPLPESNRYLLIAGRRRFAAATELGWKTLKVTITRGNLAELKIQALVENLQREDNTPYELALVFRQLVDAHKKTNEQIAKSCGKTSGFVSQHLMVTKAPKKLQRGLRDDKVGVSVFRYLHRLDQTEDKVIYDKLVDAALSGTPASKIESRVSAYLDKKKAKAAVKAAKEGQKPPKAAKKGAAAHKSKGPQLEIRDYTDTEVRKATAMVTKTVALERMTATADKLRNASQKQRRTYLQGVLDGMEELAGLVQLEQD